MLISLLLEIFYRAFGLRVISTMSIITTTIAKPNHNIQFIAGATCGAGAVMGGT
jgi:hypothetical protein